VRSQFKRSRSGIEPPSNPSAARPAQLPSPLPDNALILVVPRVNPLPHLQKSDRATTYTPMFPVRAGKKGQWTRLITFPSHLVLLLQRDHPAGMLAVCSQSVVCHSLYFPQAQSIAVQWAAHLQAPRVRQDLQPALAAEDTPEHPVSSASEKPDQVMLTRSLKYGRQAVHVRILPQGVR
jgi:hypothetical protein